MKETFYVFVCVVAAFAMVIGFILNAFFEGEESGKKVGRRESEHAAVLAGHAEYYLNDKFERQWRWKEAK